MAKYWVYNILLADISFCELLTGDEWRSMFQFIWTTKVYKEGEEWVGEEEKEGGRLGKKSIPAVVYLCSKYRILWSTDM